MRQADLLKVGKYLDLRIITLEKLISDLIGKQKVTETRNAVFDEMIKSTKAQKIQKIIQYLLKTELDSQKANGLAKSPFTQKEMAIRLLSLGVQENKLPAYTKLSSIRRYLVGLKYCKRYKQKKGQ